MVGGGIFYFCSTKKDGDWRRYVNGNVLSDRRNGIEPVTTRNHTHSTVCTGISHTGTVW